MVGGENIVVMDMSGWELGYWREGSINEKILRQLHLGN
jgi:hypothetical protein